MLYAIVYPRYAGSEQFSILKGLDCIPVVTDIQASKIAIDTKKAYLGRINRLYEITKAAIQKIVALEYEYDAVKHQVIFEGVVPECLKSEEAIQYLMDFLPRSRGRSKELQAKSFRASLARIQKTYEDILSKSNYSAEELGLIKKIPVDPSHITVEDLTAAQTEWATRMKQE